MNIKNKWMSYFFVSWLVISLPAFASLKSEGKKYKKLQKKQVVQTSKVGILIALFLENIWWLESWKRSSQHEARRANMAIILQTRFLMTCI